MSITIGMRDLVRNSSVLNNHDFVDIEDKRSHQYKGVFVSAAHAQKVKDFLEQNIEAEKQARINKKLDAIMKIAGTLTIDPKYNNMSAKEMRIKIAHEKYGESK